MRKMTMQAKMLCCCNTQDVNLKSGLLNFPRVCAHKSISVFEIQMNNTYISVSKASHRKNHMDIKLILSTELVDTMHFESVSICHADFVSLSLSLCVSANLIWLIVCCRYLLCKQPSWICRISLDSVCVVFMHLDSKWTSMMSGQYSKNKNERRYRQYSIAHLFVALKLK